LSYIKASVPDVAPFVTNGCSVSKHPSSVGNQETTGQRRGMMPENRVVFIIDDDAAFRASLTFSLEIEGFKVRSYPDAGEFLSEAELPGSACVVIDYSLPDAPGLEVLRTLRARGVMIPAILITSNVNPHLRERAVSVGAGVVEKPDLGNPLIEAIRAVMCPSDYVKGGRIE
jgi:two-component system, LuxR family, response regulator FixJ